MSNDKPPSPHTRISSVQTPGRRPPVRDPGASWPPPSFTVAKGLEVGATDVAPAAETFSVVIGRVLVKQLATCHWYVHVLNWGESLSTQRVAIELSPHTDRDSLCWSVMFARGLSFRKRARSGSISKKSSYGKSTISMALAAPDVTSSHRCSSGSP